MLKRENRERRTNIQEEIKKRRYLRHHSSLRNTVVGATEVAKRKKTDFCRSMGYRATRDFGDYRFRSCSKRVNIFQSQFFSAEDGLSRPDGGDSRETWIPPDQEIPEVRNVAFRLPAVSIVTTSQGKE